MKEFAKIPSHYYKSISNGQAERTVKTMKNLLLNTKDPYMALMSYRAMPPTELNC